MQGLRLGTRGSPLALAQARKVAAAIETAQRWPDGWVQIVAITTTGDAVPGTYDVVVSHLAKAQVSASSSKASDIDTASVGDGGTLKITSTGGTADVSDDVDYDITVTGSVTLTTLANQINAKPNIPVTASIVQSAPGEYRLVLTSKSTGLANSFEVSGGLTSSLIGNSGTSFTDPTAQEAFKKNSRSGWKRSVPPIPKKRSKSGSKTKRGSVSRAH